MLNFSIKTKLIDTSHFLGSGWSRGMVGVHKKPKIPLHEILVESRLTSSGDLRKRLVKEGILKNVCAKCGCDGNWMGSPITLQLDHINGDHSDNRLHNLQILCPNCHATTDTWGGRNILHNDDPNVICACGGRKAKSSIMCAPCRVAYNKQNPKSLREPPPKKERPRKFNPSREELIHTLTSLNWNLRATGAAYNVSDNAIKKRCKSLGITNKVPSTGLEPVRSRGEV